MALPNVKILLQNGALGGLLRFAEGVAGLCGTGVAVTGKIGVGDPRVIFSLQDAEDLGITEDDNPTAYRQVKEFYAEAGDGAELYVMLVPDTMEQNEMVDNTNASGAKKLLDYAEGRVRLLGTFFEPPVGYTLDDANGIDEDVFTAIPKAQVLAEAYAAVQTPLRVLLEGRDFNGTAADLTDLRTMTKNRVGVVVGSTDDDGSASVGLALGRAAKNPVQRKISRVKDGSLPISAAYVGANSVNTYSGLGLMHDKGYIVIRTFAGISGYFFSDDLMAALPTDDYNMLCRGRVIDKAQVIAYGTYIEELHDEVPVDAAGKLDAGVISYLEAKIKNQLNLSMVANREVSSARAVIDPNQDIITTSKLEVVLKITPVGYASEIEVKLGFENPNV